MLASIGNWLYGGMISILSWTWYTVVPFLFHSALWIIAAIIVGLVAIKLLGFLWAIISDIAGLIFSLIVVGIVIGLVCLL